MTVTIKHHSGIYPLFSSLHSFILSYFFAHSYSYSLSISRAILKNPKLNDKIRMCKFLTTDTATWQSNPEYYRLVTVSELDRLREEGMLVYEGEDKGLFGSSRQVALSLEDIRGVSSSGGTNSNGSNGGSSSGNNSKVGGAIKVAPCLIDGPPEMLEALSK